MPPAVVLDLNFSPHVHMTLDLNLSPQVHRTLDLNFSPAQDEDDLMVEDHTEQGANHDQQAENTTIVHVEENTAGVHRPPRRDLPNEHKFAAYIALKALTYSLNRAIEKKDKELVAHLLHTSEKTVGRIWNKANLQIAQGLEVDVSNQKKGRSGRKRKDLDLSRIPTIPLNRRKTLRALSRSLGVSLMTLHRRFSWGNVRRHTSSLKPSLKAANKLSRLKFCISMLDEDTLQSDSPRFIDMKNIVHIDEKWFDMTKNRSTYYLLPEESDPHRTVQNKNSIGKVMFLTAVARPRHDENGVVTFDGKIGTWAFVKEKPAARRSRYRERGTLELKSVTVTRDVMRRYLCEKVIPTIKDLWPVEDVGSTIFIQQDNARPHVFVDDKEFLDAVAETGLDIWLMQQPTNSPDMNVLD